MIRELRGLLDDIRQALQAQQSTVDEGADHSPTSAEHLAEAAEEAAARKALQYALGRSAPCPRAHSDALLACPTIRS